MDQRKTICDLTYMGNLKKLNLWNKNRLVAARSNGSEGWDEVVNIGEVGQNVLTLIYKMNKS